MIRIRAGASWRHDPRWRAALSRAAAPARAAAARAIVDALAFEVDGVDITAGRAEGALLPSLEGLLRAVAGVVAGEAHAEVPFRDGGLELVIRRRGSSALLTVVAFSRPTQVLAQDVEVELDALAAAALEAAAQFCRELAALAPDAARESRRLRAAARDLRRSETQPAPRPRRPPARARQGPPAPAPGRGACLVELGDDEGLLLAYQGGRPDLGSLLVPGALRLVAPGGAPLAAASGYPFLLLRDLSAGADGLVAAVRRKDPRAEVRVAHGRPGADLRLKVDVAGGTAAATGAGAAGAEVAFPALALARAVSEAALELGRVARQRNPRQGENALLVDLEASAAGRLAEIEELEAGELSRPGAPPERAPAVPRLPQRPLGPGRLRRLSFHRTFALDVGEPAGPGLWARGALLVAAGRDGVAAVERAAGRVAWRAPGASFAAALPGAVLVVRGRTVAALAPRSGRTLWTRPLPGAAPGAAVALAHGPYVLAEPCALAALAPESGRTLWRFEAPGAARLDLAAFGGLAVVAADTGFVYGVDAAGRTAWRLRAPFPPAGGAAAVAGACLLACGGDGGAALVALDPATGERRWEAPLDLAPTGPPVAWGRRLAVAGTVAGDPVVTLLERTGAPAWTVAPPLEGGVALAAAGALLAVRDRAGALLALARDGEARWTRAAPGGHPPRSAPPPAVARGTLVVPGDGITCLDARTGALLAAVPGVAPVRLAVDAGLALAAMDSDGVVTGFRLRTHLSVV